jgi:YVTN family beta-propeller protein
MMAAGNPVPDDAFDASWDDQLGQDAYEAILAARQQPAGAMSPRGHDWPPRPPHRVPGRPSAARPWLIAAAAMTAVLAIAVGAGLVGLRAFHHRNTASAGGTVRLRNSDRTSGATGIRQVAVIPVGSSPLGVAADPQTGTVYVVNTFGSGATGKHGTVSVIDARTRAVTAAIKVEAAPQGIAVDSQRDKIYVANAQANNVNGNPKHGTVSVISGATGKLTATVRVGHTPLGVAADPQTGTIYVTNANGNSVSVISEATDKVTATVRVGRSPFGVAADPLTGTIYVTNGSGNSVAVINGRTNKVTNMIPVGQGPTGIAVNAQTDTIYVANAFSNSVSVINGTTNEVVETITIGHQPQWVAVDPATSMVYVTSFRGNSVSVIDGPTGKVTATIAVGKMPQGIAVDDGHVYVANQFQNTVSVLGS